MEERRKFPRFKCLLPAEVLKAGSKTGFIDRISVHDMSAEGLRLVVNFNKPDPGSEMELKLYVPEKSLLTFLSAEIAWSKFSDSKLETGLRIKEIDKKIKEEILNWLFPGWRDKGEF